MNRLADELLDKAGEGATAVISNAAGAVADPKTAMQKTKRSAKSMGPIAALVALVLAVLVVKLRRRGGA